MFRQELTVPHFTESQNVRVNILKKILGKVFSLQLPCMHSLPFLLHIVKRCLYVLLALYSKHFDNKWFRFHLVYLKNNEIKLHWQPEFYLCLHFLLIMKAMVFK